MNTTIDWTERDRQGILDTDCWPHWPLLPVKRRVDAWKRKDGMGFIVAELPLGHTVYIGNIFMVGTGKLGDLLAPLEKVEYPSLEAMLAEWRVD